MKFPLIIRRVSGDSMKPTLRNRQLVLGLRSNSRRPARKGQIVIFAHNGLEKIKRIKAVTKSGSVEFVGDNQQVSTDSRTFGLLDAEVIIARVLTRR